MTRRFTQAILVLLLTPFIWLLATTPAFAHERLVSSTPASGASVIAPTTVQLKFSAPVVSTGSRIEVKDPTKKVVSSDLALEGDTVSVQFPAPTTTGTYAVRWRVTSQDGHPISGDFTFTAIAASASSRTSDPTPPPPSAPPASSSSAVKSTPVPTQRIPTNETNNEPGWIIGAVGAVALAIAAGVLISRRRLTDDEPADGPAAGDN